MDRDFPLKQLSMAMLAGIIFIKKWLIESVLAYQKAGNLPVGRYTVYGKGVWKTNE